MTWDARDEAGVRVRPGLYHVRMRVLNPNASGIPVRGLSYSIEINQREFAYGVSNQAMDIPAFGEAVLDVEVVSNLLNMISQLRGMGDAPPEQLDYRLSGKLSLQGGGRVPFDYSGTLDFRPKADGGAGI